MFCKHCGKNIYDLEKCPFCNDGEKLESSEPQSSNPTDGKTELEEVPKEETTEAENKSSESTTAESKAEVKKTSFFDQLCEENKFFKFLNSSEKIFYYFFGGGILLFVFIMVFCYIKDINIQFSALFLTIFEILLFVDFFASQIADLIIPFVFVIQMKKKKPSNELLFNGVCPEGKFEYSASTINEITWQGISAKYYKAPFFLFIFQNIIIFITSVLSYILFLAPMCNYIFIHSQQILEKSVISTIISVFTGYFKNEIFIRENLGIIIAIILLLIVRIAIIDTVLTKMHKKIAKRYEANEL